MLNKKRLIMMGSVVMLSISSVGGCGPAPKGTPVSLRNGTEVGIEQEGATGSYNIQKYDEENSDSVAVNADSGSTTPKGSQTGGSTTKTDTKDKIKSIDDFANNITTGLFQRGENHNKKDNKNTNTVASNSTATDTSSKNDGKADDNKASKKEENGGQASENTGATKKPETPKNEGNGSPASNPSGSSSSKPSGNSGSSASNPSGNSGGSTGGSSNTPVKQECSCDWEPIIKTIHHDAVTHVVHHPVGSHVVHHDAVTHTVHHDAVTHTVRHEPEGYWTQRQWVVTQAASQGVSYVVCECGFRSQDPLAVGRHQEDALLNGDFSHARSWNETSQGTPEQGYWKEPEWIQTKAAWDEVVVDKAAYDEVVVDKAAWDETVVDSKAWDETVVDKVAYDEKVISGYRCRKCGKTK